MLVASVVVQQQAADQQAADEQKPKEEQPPAAVGEEPAKPTRSFFPTLLVNLGDDLKHMPQWNSVYWLAGGGAVALLAHPNDNKINRQLLGSDFADKAFVPGKWIGSTGVILGAGAASYPSAATKGRNACSI